MRLQVGTASFLFSAIFVLAVASAQGQAATAATPAQANSGSQASAPASDSQAAQSAAPAGTETASTTTPKKVWTNEDVGDLRGRSPISTVGPSRPKSQKPVAQSKQAVASPDTIRSYHDRIAALQAKLPPIDSQISDLQGALNGQTMNSTRHATGAKIDDWHDELTRLQAQRSDLETKIGALQDEARHKGVPENQIPE
jgi:hypothetical protein